MSIMRIALGSLAGVVVGLCAVTAGDTLNHLIFPPPPPDQWASYVATAPFTVFVGLVVTYAAAAFLAAFTAAKIAVRVWPGWIAGGLLTAATFANLFMITHPLWMTIICVMLTPLAAWFGAKAARPRIQSLIQ